MQKKIIPIITLGIVITSCVISKQKFDINLAEKNPKSLTSDIDSCLKTQKKVYLSEVFKHVKTIILETNSDVLLDNINSIQVYGDKIFILDNNKSMGLYLFDKNGKFIQRIGSVGQGPGEYVRLDDFTIDKKNKLIYVLDSYTHNILKYDLMTGKYISDIRLRDHSISSHHIQCVGDKLYVDATNRIKGGETFLIQEINLSTGEIAKKWLPALVYNSNISDLNHIGQDVFYDKMQDSPKFIQTYMNTLMTFNKQGVVPYLTIKSIDFITGADMAKIKSTDAPGTMDLLKIPKILGINAFTTYKNIIYYNCKYKEYLYKFIYNTTTGKTSRLNGTDELVYDINKENVGLIPKFYTSSDDGMYSIVHPLQMKSFLELAKAGKLAKNLDKRDQLMKLSDDANPVIFVYE